MYSAFMLKVAAMKHVLLCRGLLHTFYIMQEGAEEAFSLLKSVMSAVTPANDDMRTALRSLAGAVGSQAHALSTESLVDTLALLGTCRLLSDNTALNLVTELHNRFEQGPIDQALLSSCAAAMVQLRSNYEGTHADEVAGASTTKTVGTSSVDRASSCLCVL